MCGIAGIIGPEASSTALERMLQAIEHRGDPESAGETYAQDGFALGTNRLRIVDPGNGRQPCLAPGGRVACVLNGEIYNHAELREELAPHYEFRSHCDTEVVLAAYLQWGPEMVERLRGMYAVAVVDRPRGRTLLARDPLGIKPLYYATAGKSLWFASELKAFRKLDAGIFALPPGSTWTEELRRFWRVPPFGLTDEGAEPGTIVARALEESVRSHLPPGEEPLACLLSGGVDSSTVLYLASSLYPGPVEAWTFATTDADAPDLEAARVASAHLGVPLRVVSPASEELTRFYLDCGVWMTETWTPALVRNAVSYHFLCRGVHDAGHKLCLSGEGADEVFGGYDYLWRLPESDRERAIRDSLAQVHRTYLQMADRAAMCAQLEVRVPYMDRDFVTRVVGLGPGSRMTASENKYGLRTAFPDHLPEVIRNRPKQGMNAGAGFGSNNPRDGMYYNAVIDHYRIHPERLQDDRRASETHGTEFGVDTEDLEEVFNFARFVEAGFDRLRGAKARPQVNVSNPTRPIRSL